MAQGAKPGEGGQLPGQQGLPVDRRHPARHRRCRADLAAAAPRHLLDRGSQAADPRPAQRQPGGRGVGEAGLGPRCRHRRGRRDQGARRQGDRRRQRRRHRRGAADLAQAHRAAVGTRPGRDPADAAAQPAARAGQGAGRRRAEDRPRRGRRRPARRRGVRLLHRSAGGRRLRDDAGLPPGHLPGRHRHPEPGAARRATPARRSSSRRSSSTWPSRSANTLRPLASGRSTRPSGTPRCWMSRPPSRTTGRTASTSRRCWRSPRWPAITRAPTRRSTTCPRRWTPS